MINTAMTVEKNDFNPFTTKLAEKCREKGSVLVQLRNETIVAVELYEDLEDPTEVVHFRSTNYEYSWHLDGSSYKSFNYDIMMMGSDRLLKRFWSEFV